MKITTLDREGKLLVVKTEPQLTAPVFVAFKEIIQTRGYAECKFTQREGCLVIGNAWPFEIEKNVEELRNAVRAAAEVARRKEADGTAAEVARATLPLV
jgi:hypothetical protein